MAEDFGEKTEPATPRRRAEARGRGQVPRSADLTAAVLMLGGLLALRFYGTRIWYTLLAVTRAALSRSDAAEQGHMLPIAIAAAKQTVDILMPSLLIAFALALLINYAQVGLLFTLQPVTPSLSKLNPLGGLMRLFAARSSVTLASNLVKLALVAAVAGITIHGQLNIILMAVAMDHVAVLAAAVQLAFSLGVRLAIVLLILAIIDYCYQRYRHERDLRMSKEEIKEELRSMEGDPVVKRRRRQVQLQLALQRVRSAVPKADVVVTNPTHLAIAIQYDLDTMSAPVVVAKGADYVALRIREIAAAHGIPIVERRALARLMYDAVEVGKEIPGRFYQAIAEILAYVYELTGRTTLGTQHSALRTS